MSEENSVSNTSRNTNLVSVKNERDDEDMENRTPTKPTETHQVLPAIRTKFEDDISDADSTPPQATKDDYDFMKTPEYVPSYVIKDEQTYSDMPTPERVLNEEIENEILDGNINKNNPQLDPKNNCDNNVDETVQDDSTGNHTNSTVQNYEIIPDDFFGDSVFTAYQVKNEPSSMQERVSNDEITDQTNKTNGDESTEIDTNSAKQNYEIIPDDFFGDSVFTGYEVKSEPMPERMSNDTITDQTKKNAIPINQTNQRNNPENNNGDDSTEIDTNSAKQIYEEIPDDFFGDYTHEDPSYRVKKEPSAGVVPKMERVTNDDTNQTEIIMNTDAKNNVGTSNFYRRNNLEEDHVPREEASDDNFYGAFPVKSEKETPTNTQDHTDVGNNDSYVDQRKTPCNDEIPSRSEPVFVPTTINENSSPSLENNDKDLEMIRLEYLKKLEELSDEELPCSSSSLKKRKKKHHKYSNDSEGEDYKRQKRNDRNGGKHYESHRHKRERERRSPSLSTEHSHRKRRRDYLTSMRTETKIEHGFHSNEMEIILRPDEKKYIQPKLKLIKFNNLIQHINPPSLSETLEEKIKKILDRAIKQLKTINSSHGSSSKNFIFTQTMSTAKNNRSILSQINLNPSPLSSSKEFIFSLTSIGACVNLSDYGLHQPPELSQHLMRTLGRDINHLEEMRQTTKLPPKISTKIDLANSVKTESKKYKSMLYRDTDTQTDEHFFKKGTRDVSTQYCDINFVDIKDNNEKQKYAILMMQEAFNTPVYSASEEIQQNMRIYEAVKAANKKYR